MPHDSNSNAPSSAKTSSKPPATPLSEAQYLAKQQADAKKAIAHTLEQLKHDVIGAVDPRAWMQVRPWTALGATAVAGFVAAAAAVPSKEQQALNRLTKLEEALQRAEHPERFDDRAKAKPGGSGVTGLLYRVLQPMILSTLTGFLSGKAAAEPTAGSDPGAEAYTTEATPTAVDAGI